MVRRTRLTRKMSLLDVCCGPDSLAAELRAIGYQATELDCDADASAPGSADYDGRADSLAEIEDRFDVILFRHSFERMPSDVLGLARDRIQPNGCCAVRIVLLGWAWKTYGVDWANLSAPSHPIIHTLRSFSLHARKSGFRVSQVVFDSDEYQFWKSDSLQRNIPLDEITEPNASQRALMRRLAKSLNQQHQGDSAQFYLTPV